MEKLEVSRRFVTTPFKANCNQAPELELYSFNSAEYCNLFVGRSNATFAAADMKALRDELNRIYPVAVSRYEVRENKPWGEFEVVKRIVAEGIESIAFSKDRHHAEGIVDALHAAEAR